MADIETGGFPNTTNIDTLATFVAWQLLSQWSAKSNMTMEEKHQFALTHFEPLYQKIHEVIKKS